MPLKIIATPKKQLLAQEMRHTITKIGGWQSSQFLLCSPFYPTPKILCFTILFNRPDTPKRPSSWASTPHVIQVPWTHLTQHLKLHLDWFSCFCTAHGRESLYFNFVITLIAVINFYSARNARIASAVLATAIPSVCPSVCLSIRHTPV